MGDQTKINANAVCAEVISQYQPVTSDNLVACRNTLQEKGDCIPDFSYGSSFQLLCPLSEPDAKQLVKAWMRDKLKPSGAPGKPIPEPPVYHPTLANLKIVLGEACAAGNEPQLVHGVLDYLTPEFVRGITVLADVNELQSVLAGKGELTDQTTKTMFGDQTRKQLSDINVLLEKRKAEIGAELAKTIEAVIKSASPPAPAAAPVAATPLAPQSPAAPAAAAAPQPTPKKPAPAAQVAEKPVASSIPVVGKWYAGFGYWGDSLTPDALTFEQTLQAENRYPGYSNPYVVEHVLTIRGGKQFPQNKLLSWRLGGDIEWTNYAARQNGRYRSDFSTMAAGVEGFAVFNWTQNVRSALGLALSIGTLSANKINVGTPDGVYTTKSSQLLKDVKGTVGVIGAKWGELETMIAVNIHRQYYSDEARGTPLASDVKLGGAFRSLEVYVGLEW